MKRMNILIPDVLSGPADIEAEIFGSDADIIIGMGTAKKGSLVPTPTPMKKEARIRKRKRFFSKLMQYM